MPASSVSGLLSTSVYFISMLLLLALLVGPAANLYTGASLQAAKHLADGIAAEVNDLVPGMTTKVGFDPSLGTRESVSLSGTLVTATVNGQSAAAALDWPAVNASLVAGTPYIVYLADGVVQVG